MTHFCAPTLTSIICLKYPRGLKQQLLSYYKVKALPNTQLKFQEKIPRIVDFIADQILGLFFPIFARAPCTLASLAPVLRYN